MNTPQSQVTSKGTRTISSITIDAQGSIYNLDIKTGIRIYTGDMANKIKLNHKVPIVAFDEVTVTAKNEGMIDIIFSQTTNEITKEADIVAAIRCANTEQLKGVLETINDTLKKEAEREL